jgi:rubrerythrin
MKKCPSCYAIMKESIKPSAVPALQQKPTNGTPEVSAVRVRYECSQCGHTEESFAKPAPAPKHG